MKKINIFKDLIIKNWKKLKKKHYDVMGATIFKFEKVSSQFFVKVFLRGTLGDATIRHRTNGLTC